MTATDLTLTHHLVERYLRRRHPDIITNTDRDVVGYRRAIYLRSASGFAEIGHGGECTTQLRPWWVKSGGSTFISTSLAASLNLALLYLMPTP